MTEQNEENSGEQELKDSVDLLKFVISQRKGGELREQQEVAVADIEQALIKKEALLIQAATGTGKALDVNTPILTTYGWKTMGTLEVGDSVFDFYGNPTKILDVLPIYKSEQVYEVLFNTGEKIIADAPHLWVTASRAEREQYWKSNQLGRNPLITDTELQIFRENLIAIAEQIPDRIGMIELSRKAKIPYSLIRQAASTLEFTKKFPSSKYYLYSTVELLEQVYRVALSQRKIHTKDGLVLSIKTTQEIQQSLITDTLAKYTNHSIPIVQDALIFEEQDFSRDIEPYTLGAWLGDGTSNEATITDYYGVRNGIQQDGYFLAGRPSNEHVYHIDITPVPVNNKWHDSFKKRLHNLQIINNKHIPEKYLFSSVKQREDLLAGLLDTDGFVDKNGMIEIALTNEKLINDVYDLVLSLGYKANMRIKPAGYNGKITGTAHTVSFMTSKNPFRLAYKGQMWEERFNKETHTSFRNNQRFIVDVKPVPATSVRCITVDNSEHLYLAGRQLIPTHNSISYLIPSIFTGKRVVVSTATKQLGEQLAKIDIPFLTKIINKYMPNKKFKAVLLKGRENYYCYAKGSEQERLSDSANSLFGIMDVENTKGMDKSTAKGLKLAKEVTKITEWVNTTKTGDRSEAPAVSDQIWRQFSSTTAECPGRNACPFGSSCFAEIARDNAKDANIVITNHALVGHDLNGDDDEGGRSVFGERDAFIFDEVHELDSYLTSAWGTELSANMLKDAAKVFRQLNDIKTEDIEEFERVTKKFNPVAKNLPEGRIVGEQKLLGELMARIYASTMRISTVASKFAKDSEENDRKRKNAIAITKTARDIMHSCQLLLDDSVNTVRWVSLHEEIITLKAAPLRIGPQLQEALSKRGSIMIGTSATITVAGSFEIPIHNLGMDLSSTPYKTVELDSPFDYKKQAMIYIPNPAEFPAPVGAERFEHTEAVKKEVVDLVKAAGGRTLVLCTTSYAAKDNGANLREALPDFNILIQGEAPNQQLIDEFKEDEQSVLVATMGLWQGLDAVGETLSQVIIDKIPFPPMNDPLLLARQEWAESTGRNGFMDVYVADANIALSQGAGRLIRSKFDKGLISILDTRLLTKPYGRSMLKSLPDARVFQNKKTVLEALNRLHEASSKKSP